MEKLPEKTFLTVHELMEILSLPRTWIYDHTRKGSLDRIPGAHRFGKHLRFFRIDVEKWMNDHRVK